MTTEAPLNTISPARIAHIILEHMRTLVSVILLGPPGCGKTEIPRATCPASHHYVEVSLTACTDLEFAGPTMPDPTTRTAIAYQAAWYAQAMAEAPDKPWFIVFDELTMASVDAQRLGTCALLEKHIRGWKFPAGSIVIATGNRTQDGTRAVPVLSTLRTRAFTYTVQVDPQAWLVWAKSVGLDARVISFIDANPTMLSPDDDAGLITPDSPAPNPRTWTLLARQLAAGTAPDGDIVGAAVGDVCGRAFLLHLETHHASLQFAGALDNPGTAPIPTDPAESDAAKRYLVTTLQHARLIGSSALHTAVKAALLWVVRWPLSEARQAAVGRITVGCRDTDVDLTVAPYTSMCAAILSRRD